MLDKVKAALCITVDAYDAALNRLIVEAEADLALVGIAVDETNALHERAIITFCRANFKSPTDYANVKASYDEQKAQLISHFDEEES